MHTEWIDKYCVTDDSEDEEVRRFYPRDDYMICLEEDRERHWVSVVEVHSNGIVKMLSPEKEYYYDLQKLKGWGCKVSVYQIACCARMSM